MTKYVPGVLYTLLIHFYSLNLIVLGASFKYMLKFVKYMAEKYSSSGYASTEEGYSDKYETIANTSDYGDSDNASGYDDGKAHLRLLAGSGLDPDENSQKAVTMLYTLSLVAVLIIIELMALVAAMANDSENKMSSSHRIVNTILVLAKGGSVVFLGTLVKIIPGLDLAMVAIIGFCIVFFFNLALVYHLGTFAQDADEYDKVRSRAQQDIDKLEQSKKISEEFEDIDKLEQPKKISEEFVSSDSKEREDSLQEGPVN